MKYLIYNPETRMWWKASGKGTTDHLGEAHRWTADELDKEFTHRVPHELVVFPEAGWYERDFCIYDSDADEYLAAYPDEDDSNTWEWITSQNVGDVVVFPTDRQARAAAEHIHAQLVAEDEIERDYEPFEIVPAPIRLPKCLGGKVLGTLLLEVGDPPEEVSEDEPKIVVLDQGIGTPPDPQIQSDQIWLDHYHKFHVVHPENDCVRPCAIHEPSKHHMLTWPATLNDSGDGLVMVRRCKHYLWHPDPDDIRVREAPHRGAHSCDGCCIPD